MRLLRKAGPRASLFSICGVSVMCESKDGNKQDACENGDPKGEILFRTEGAGMQQALIWVCDDEQNM